MAYLNQLQPANAMKPNLDVAARGPQKKKKGSAVHRDAVQKQSGRF